jgi:hypothetical protein
MLTVPTIEASKTSANNRSYRVSGPNQSQTSAACSLLAGGKSHRGEALQHNAVTCNFLSAAATKPRPLWEAWFSTNIAIPLPGISAAVWPRSRRISVGILHRYHRLGVKGQLNPQEKQRFSK